MNPINILKLKLLENNIKHTNKEKDMEDLTNKINDCQGKYSDKKINRKLKGGIEQIKYCTIIPYKSKKQKRICPYQGLPFEYKKGSQLKYKCIYPK